MIYTKIVIICTLLLEIFTYKVWLVCERFNDRLHFSASVAQLRLNGEIHNDIGYAPELARFFHNKVTIYGTELFNNYVYFWDIRFAILFFSIIGCFGVICGFWYLLRNKKKTYKTWLVLISLLFLPFIEIFRIELPYWARMLIISLPYYLFSLFGIWQFINNHKRWGIIIVIVLIFISIWYTLVFQKDIYSNFCYN